LLIDQGKTAMSQIEYEAAVAQFLAKKAVTRCPTACVVPTRVSVAEADIAALRTYSAAREAARLARLQTYQQRLAV
jgi:hypothetical protein